MTFAPLFCRLAAALLFLSGAPAAAQALPKPAPAEPATEPAPADLYGRDTPEGTISGFVAAIADQDFERASKYLDLTGSAAQKRRRGSLLARQLGQLLDSGGQLLPRAVLSNAPAGNLDDGLAPELDRVGEIDLGDKETKLLVERVERPGGGGSAWLISSETIAAVPELLALDQRRTILEQALPAALLENDLWGAPAGHWLALLVLAITGLALSSLIVAAILAGDRAFWRRQHRVARTFLQNVAAPLRLWIAVVFVQFGSAFLGVSIVARQLSARALDVIGWFALAWLVWRLIDAAGEVLIRRLRGGGRAQVAAIATFVRRLIKALVFAFAAIAILDTLGYNVTAGIAALGIGGLVLALGAQKTVENLIAGVSVLADRPVKVGEVCKVGDTLGTVEELGLRSTKIRTLEQTLVVIPNSDLAAKQIENFSRRSTFWFHPMIALPLDTQAGKIRAFAEQVGTRLAACPNFQTGPPRVRLLGIGGDRLTVEIFGFLNAADYDDFLRLQEELTYAILDLLEQLGLELAAPTTQLSLPRSGETDPLPKPDR